MGSPGLCTQYRQRVSTHGQGQDVESNLKTNFVMPPTVCLATEGGFYGFLHTIPAGVRMSILEGDQVKDSLSEISDRHSMGKVLLKGS